MSVKEKMTAIADAIRIRTGGEDKLTLDAMAQGITEVYESGKQAEYERFWDSHPIATSSYAGINLFSGKGWNNTTFNPKYDIVPSGSCYMMFKACGVTDLVSQSEKCGIKIDFSQANNMYYAFSESSTTHIGEIPLLHNNFTVSASNTGGLFSYAYVRTIDKIIVNNEGTTRFSNDMFSNANFLANIRFEGVIGNNINFQYSPLTAKSLVSVIEHLSNTATGKTATFKKTAVSNADWNTTDYASWDELVATKPNWTISLV